MATRRKTTPRKATRAAPRKASRAASRTKAAPRATKAKAPKIVTFLTFNNQAEEAVKLYVATFKNSRILETVRGRPGGPIPEGQLLNATFELDGHRFMAMDGGPYFSFAPGVSLLVNCETQQEIDRLWAKLSEGGEQQPCGWLKDRFGVSWQVVPKVLGEMMADPRSGNSEKLMEAMLKMSKLDIATLERAYREP